jgi:hypothetical protein
MPEVVPGYPERILHGLLVLNALPCQGTTR